MPRPDRRAEQRAELAETVARAFAELGYRRATTAEIAARCRVRENILYRLWPDKRAMFVAALDHVYAHSEATWSELLSHARGDASPAVRILSYEARHHGELGLYRIVFAGLSETDDPEITAAVRSVYGRFQRFVRAQVEAHRELAGGAEPDDAAEPARADADLVAWAIVGLGTAANIGREVGLLSARARKRLMGEVGRVLLDA